MFIAEGVEDLRPLCLCWFGVLAIYDYEYMDRFISGYVLLG